MPEVKRIMRGGRAAFLLFLPVIALISCFQPKSRLGPESDGGTADQAPPDDAPAGDAPADQPPADQAPTDDAPFDQESPDQESPDQGLFDQEEPADQAPTDDAPSDQGSPADDAADSGSDAPAGCDPSHSFGTPSLVGGLDVSVNGAQSARFTLDELRVYFHRDDGNGDNNIYTASRINRTESFGPGLKVAGINSEASDAWPAITADGQEMVFESFRYGAGQVFSATKKPGSNDFSGPIPVVNINDKPSNVQPFILANGSAIYFASTRIGGDGSYLELFVAHPADVPVLVSSVNSASNQFLPVLTPDELTIYFASDRPDPLAKGAFDIWMATRSSRSDDFSSPANLQQLNTDAEDLPQWISPDNCRLYFSQMHNGARTIYVAERAM